MAYTQGNFVRDLALWSTATLTGATRQRKFLEYAAKKGIQLGAFGARKAAIPAARGAGQLALAAARRYPATAIGLAGYGAYQAGAFDPLEQAIEEEVEQRLAMRRASPSPELAAQITAAAGQFKDPIYGVAAKLSPARKVSAYAKGVKAGMKALKASRYNGKAGMLSNAKKAFSTVSKTVSKVAKGKKVGTTGATGVIARAARKVPGIKSIKVRK